MIDVARLAGVSHQTVSRVLNGKPHVRPDLQRRVEEAVRILGYRRNKAARALATNRTMTLGVISIGTSQYGPSQALFGIARSALEASYATTLVALENVERSSIKSALEQLTRDSVDGVVIISPITAAAEAAAELSAPMPIVKFEPGLGTEDNVVAHDEESAARLAVRCLIESGCTTVHHVSGPDGWLGTDARIRGWRKELADHQRVAYEPVAGDWSAESGYRVARDLLRDPEVQGVYAANDQMALGVLHAARELGRRVPEDLSVVGFDDIPEARFFDPPLTTVRLDFSEVGRRCTEALLQLIGGETSVPGTVVGSELIVRESTPLVIRGQR